MFEKLKNRGLKNVNYIISDNHFGLIKALKRNFQGVCWQRYQVHFQHNVLGATPRQHRDEMAQILKKILKADFQSDARKIFNELCDTMQQKSKKATDIFECGFDDSIAVLSLPQKYRKYLPTTNMIERLNEESALRLIGSLMVEQMDQYLQWRKEDIVKIPQNVTTIWK